jgi:DMSO/TMAO reductase YedYZ molybdopterin-dependent catalytic subunit
LATRGFFGRPPGKDVTQRPPPGQHVTDDFPVLAYGPTPRVDLAQWRFSISHGSKALASWNWAEFQALPTTTWHGDIHCVTQWSKFDTAWEGVTIDDLLANARITPLTSFALALSHDDYSTNVPVADLVGDDRDPLRRRCARSGTRWSGAIACTTSVFLEEREVGQRASLYRARRTGILGTQRLPYVWRSVARTTLH